MEELFLATICLQAAPLLWRQLHASKPGLTSRHFSSLGVGGSPSLPASRLRPRPTTLPESALCVCPPARPPGLKACVVFHWERLSLSTVPCVFSSASACKPSAPPATQTSGQEAPNEWSRDPAEASQIKGLSITHYLHEAAMSGEREKHDESRPNETKGRRGPISSSSSFFFIFIKHFLWRFNEAEGHSSQLKQGIKKMKNRCSVCHTILCLGLFFSQKSSTCSTCAATAVAINFTSQCL